MGVASSTGSWNVGSFNQRSVSNLIRSIRDGPISPYELYTGLNYFSAQLKEEGRRYCRSCHPKPAVMIKQIDFGDFIGDVGIEIYKNRDKEYVKISSQLISAKSDYFDRETIRTIMRESPEPYITSLTTDKMLLHAGIFDEFFLLTESPGFRFVGRGDVLNDNIRVDNDPNSSRWSRLRDKAGLYLTRHGLHRFTRFSPHEVPIAGDFIQGEIQYAPLILNHENTSQVPLEDALGIRVHKNNEVMDL